MSFECQRVLPGQAEALLPILSAAEEGEERIRAIFSDPACAVYAARVDGELVGAAVVRWKGEEANEIIYIAVVAGLCGKGYGKRLIGTLQAELAERGGGALLVGTANSSLENIAFYQKCGFRMFEVRRDYFAYIQPPLREHDIVMRDMIVFRYEREWEPK